MSIFSVETLLESGNLFKKNFQSRILDTFAASSTQCPNFRGLSTSKVTWYYTWNLKPKRWIDAALRGPTDYPYIIDQTLWGQRSPECRLCCLYLINFWATWDNFGFKCDRYPKATERLHFIAFPFTLDGQTIHYLSVPR